MAPIHTKNRALALRTLQRIILSSHWLGNLRGCPIIFSIFRTTHKLLVRSSVAFKNSRVFFSAYISRLGPFTTASPILSYYSGDNSPKASNTSPSTAYGGGHYDTHNAESLRSPVESDLMTPLSLTSSVGITTPATPHSLQVMQWGSDGANHPHPQVNTYFPNPEMYAKQPGPYDVVA